MSWHIHERTARRERPTRPTGIVPELIARPPHETAPVPTAIFRTTPITHGPYLRPPPLQMRNGKKKGKRRPPKSSVKFIEDPVEHMGQDEIQEYVAGVAPPSGPIRDYIDDRAQAHGGLCAGWVVLHRKDPDRLIDMWDEVSTALDRGSKKLGVKPTDRAVKAYIEAQFHFAMDPENVRVGGYEPPGETVLLEAGLTEKEVTAPVTKKVLGPTKRSVGYGQVYATAQALASGTKASKKRLFVEVYTSSHVAQIEFANDKVSSICESEKSGVRRVTAAELAESILTSAFFERDEEDTTKELTFEVHAPK